MKKLILSLVALSVISISSCKKEEVIKPESKSDSNKISAKTLGSFD
ncbi:hypothetical protein [Daejeonella oryzae]|nr:hypothetical protein [Daejeonella oryzae]